MESGLTLCGSLRMTTNIRGLVFPKKDGLKPCGQAFTNYLASTQKNFSGSFRSCKEGNKQRELESMS